MRKQPRKRNPIARVVTKIRNKVIPDKRNKIKDKIRDKETKKDE